MQTMRKPWAWLLVLLPGRLLAQDSTAHHHKTNILFPAFSYAPETSVAAGVMDMKFFKTDPRSRLSNVAATGLYTVKNQFIAELTSITYWRQNNYLLTADLLFSKYPEYFYSIGNSTSTADRRTITYNDAKGVVTVSRKLARSFYAGIKMNYFDYYDLDSTSHTSAGQSIETHFAGGRTAGLGVQLLYDTRDNIFSARHGLYAMASVVWNQPVAGGDYRYTAYDLDLRKYLSLPLGSILALQFVGMIKTGDVPFLQLSYLGGSNIMRGFYAGRYRDNDLAAAQAEWRRQLTGKWGLVLFASEGKVFSSLGKADLSDLHQSFGFGIRRAISKNNRLNLRADLGFAQGSANVYVNFGEAF